MKSLKNPMTNAIYIALITAIYAIIFIVSSEFVFKHDHFLSDSRWSLFIQNKIQRTTEINKKTGNLTSEKCTK